MGSIAKLLDAAADAAAIIAHRETSNRREMMTFAKFALLRAVSGRPLR